MNAIAPREIVVPLTPPLLDRAIAEARDRRLHMLTDTAEFRARALAGYGRALVAPGTLLAVAGLMPHWPGRAEAWMIVTQACGGRALLRGLGWARTFLDVLQADPAWRRVEIYVAAGTGQADWSARLLGFREEGLCRAWGPEGRDYRLMARVRGGN